MSIIKGRGQSNAEFQKRLGGSRRYFAKFDKRNRHEPLDKNHNSA